MLLYVGTIVLALAIVAITKGSFRRLSQIQLRHLWLLLLALAIQIALEVITFPKARIDDVGFGVLVLSYVLILAFCVVNWKTSGFIVITVGVALNTLVIVLNQGMPTRDHTEVRSGESVEVPIERTVKHRPQKPGDALTAFSDTIAIPGLSYDLFSIGDLIIALGIVDVIFEESRRPRRFGVYLDDVAQSSPSSES